MSADAYPQPKQRVIFTRTSPECRALAARYPSLRFNLVEARIEQPHLLRELADGQDHVSLHWNLSGSRDDLLRHRFACEEWFACIRFDRRSGFCRSRVEGFGRLYMVHVTPAGYRLDYAEYDDGLDRLCGLLPPIWTPPKVRSD